MDSTELQRRIEGNPHNIRRAGLPAPMCPHDMAAATFEREGRAAYPHGWNPYNPGTMANERWAAGWHQADDATALRLGYSL